MDYRAKRHTALESLRKDLAKGMLEDTVVVNGHKFKLATLNEDEETWADTFMRTNTTASIMSSKKAPKLAAAIRALDDVPVSELFNYPDDMPKDMKDNIDANPVIKREWIRDQMLMFLAEDGIRPFINDLYEAFQTLNDKRMEAIKEVPN